MFEKLSKLNDSELLARVFEHAPIGMSLVTPDGKILKANPSLCKILGYSEEELLRLSLKELSHPEDLDKNLRLRREAMEKKLDSYRLEKRYIHKSGKIIWGLLSVTVERDQVGNAGLFISQLVDITEEKEKEQELKEIKELHELIAKNSDDILIRCNPKGMITYITSAVKKHLGYEPEEVIGRYYHEFWHPDDLNRKIASGHCEEMISYRLRHKQGHYVWQEAHPKKITDDSGKIQHIIGIGRDITYRKAMESLLKESEERYKSIVKHSPLPICAIDLEGKLTEVNPSFESMIGYSNEELESMELRDIGTSETHEDLKIRWKDLLTKSLIFEELKFKRRDGLEFDAISVTSPIIINGQTKGVYFMIRDISEQKQNQELLTKMEKLSLIGELAAGIAHEVRNPLTSLRGFIQLFQTKDNGNDRKLYYDVMLSEIDRINEIVSELLILAKPSRENAKWRSLPEKLMHVMTLLEAQANLYNIEFKKDIDPNLPLIYSQGLKQVFINILKNAIEAMPEGGKILIQANRKGDHIHIRFVDNGCGIPKDLLPKIGQPFFTTKDSGTGLGLIVCHRIIQNHKGTMHIDSEPGIGTTVEITLPIQLDG